MGKSHSPLYCVFFAACAVLFLPISGHARSEGFKEDQTNNPWVRKNNLTDDVETPLRRLSGYENVTMAQLMQNPKYFLNRKIRVPLYFARIGDHFRPYHTIYHSNYYVNFYAWPAGIALWDPEQRRNIAFTFYVSRDNKNTTRVLDRLAMVPYAPIYIYGEVTNAHARLPWVTVEKITVEDSPLHTRAALSQIELGIAQVQEAGNTTYDTRAYIIAVDAFEAALNMGLPRESEAFVYRMLGKTYLSMRKFKQASIALEESVQRNNNDVGTLRDLADVEMRLAREAGYGEKRDNHLKKGLAVAQKLVAEYPALAEGHGELGIGYALMGKWDMAKREISKARGLSPKMPMANANMARLLVLRAEARLRKGEKDSYRTFLDKADKKYVSAIELMTEEPDYHFERGLVILKIGEFDSTRLIDAVNEFDAYTSLLPNRSEGYYYQGLVQRKRNLPAKAVELMDSAISKDSKYVKAYVEKADILFNDLQDPQGAKNTLLTARDELPKSEPLHRGMLRLGKDMEDWDLQTMAIKMLTKAHPDDLALRLEAGRIYFNRHPSPDPISALKEYEAAIRLEPKSAKNYSKAYLMAGHILVRTVKNYKKGRRYLEEGLKKADFPENIQGLLDKSVAQLNLDEIKDALKAADSARKLSEYSSQSVDPVISAQIKATLAYIYYIKNIDAKLDSKAVKIEMRQAKILANEAFKQIKDIEALFDSDVLRQVKSVRALINIRMNAGKETVLVDAIGDLKNAVQSDTNNFVLYYGIAEANFQLIGMGKDLSKLVSYNRACKRYYGIARAKAKELRNTSDLANLIEKLAKKGDKKVDKKIEEIEKNAGKKIAASESATKTKTQPGATAPVKTPTTGDRRRRRRPQ